MTAFNFHDSLCLPGPSRAQNGYEYSFCIRPIGGRHLASPRRSTHSETLGHIPGPGWVGPGPTPSGPSPARPGPCFPLLAHLGPLPHAYGKGCLASGMGLGLGPPIMCVIITKCGEKSVDIVCGRSIGFPIVYCLPFFIVWVVMDGDTSIRICNGLVLGFVFQSFFQYVYILSKLYRLVLLIGLSSRVMECYDILLRVSFLSKQHT